MRRSTFKVMAVCALALVVVYIGFCYLSSLKTIQAVRQTFLSDSAVALPRSEYIQDDIYHSILSVSNGKQGVKALTIFPVFVFSNVFKSGVIHMRYSFVIRDQNSKDILQAGIGVWATLDISLIAGKWVVTRWRETP